MTESADTPQPELQPPAEAHAPSTAPATPVVPPPVVDSVAVDSQPSASLDLDIAAHVPAEPAGEEPAPAAPPTAPKEPRPRRVEAPAEGPRVPHAAGEAPKHWYVIHTQTGQEDKVKASLDTKAQQGVAGGLLAQVLIPTEKVSEVRSGKKRISERKFFPGYVLVEMALTDETWHLIKNTPGVTGFIGAGHKPVALSEDEVAQILKQTEEKKERPTPRVMFEKGEGVRVIEGPFTNFSGVIEEVNLNRGKLKAMVSIFGRATPLELEFWQVEKL